MDYSKLKRVSLHDRKSLVQGQTASYPPNKPASFLSFWESLPEYLKAKDIKQLVNAILSAKSKKKPIILMMGAHSIKVGLSPWIIKAIEQGFITALTTNGACLVHDFELAFAGNTSEDVAEALIDGSFGMTKETGITINEWIKQGATENKGLGETFARHMAESSFEHQSLSIFAAAHRQQIPATVHVALGTDVIHHHPEACGESIGKTSMKDFHILCNVVSELGQGGVVLNVGSNVVLPEVFLKALTVARNLKGPIHDFTTANFDMIQHYRPNQNVVKRPTIGGGTGYTFTGHHEIMLPLLFSALFELTL